MTAQLVASDRVARWMGSDDIDIHGMSTRDAMDAAKLTGWDLRLVEAHHHGRYHKEEFDVIRTNPWDGMADKLGQVGSRYHLFSNEELFDFADNIVHSGGMWEALGQFKHGSIVFGVMDLGDIHLGNDDDLGKKLIIHTSHDGSSNISFSINTLRYRCTNALNMGIRGAKQSFKIRHSSSAEGKVAEAREALGLANIYYDAFSEQMNALIDQQITLNEAVSIIDRVYKEPDADKKGALTRWENKRNDIVGIYQGETLENVVGTKYGVLNAMTEHIDWYRTARGGNTENLDAAFTGFDNFVNNEKQRVLDIVLAA